jgi:hypothetical protein
MEIYDVTISEDQRMVKPRRLRSFAVCLVLSTAGFFAFERLWPDRPNAFVFPGTHVSNDVVQPLFMAFFWSLFMSWYFSSKRFVLSVSEPWKSYQIVVEDDRIRTRSFASHNGMLSKTIRRGEVRTIIESERGLMASDRGRLGTYVFARIWIPRQLPEYECLKRLMTSWKEQDAA